ncbi:related to palI protein [Cephalotrichum gorgonifer]|uniref:Related to palI protein n=1 Tax=Cephalotrichum gorgonifer TaxID=2041049 RepID=A0AAE8MRW8_9PEZI|nr:related to palI protein [Cephalotrichum gorgonifer]
MKTSICNIFGSALLLVAAILLIVASVSAPVVSTVSILTVVPPANATAGEITFGTFGHCVQYGGDKGNVCSKSTLGYSPLDVTHNLSITDTGGYSRTTTRALTRVMILHPVGAVLCALAFLLTLAAGMVGRVVACLTALTAFIMVALAVVSDFVLFGIIRAVVSEDSRHRSRAGFGVAMWCVLAAAILSFVTLFGVLGTCCTGRDMEKAAEAPPPAATAAAPADGSVGGAVEEAAQPKRRFWKRG